MKKSTGVKRLVVAVDKNFKPINNKTNKRIVYYDTKKHINYVRLKNRWFRVWLYKNSPYAYYKK